VRGNCSFCWSRWCWWHCWS